MTERLKSIFLVFLICLSLFLSYEIWFSGERELNLKTSQVVNLSDLPVKLLVPEKVVINFGNRSHTVIEKDETVRSVLYEFQRVLNEYQAQKLKRSIEIADQRKWETMDGVPSIHLSYTGPIDGSIFSFVLGMNKGIFNNFSIKDFYIVVGESPLIYFRDELSGRIYKLDLGPIKSNFAYLMNQVKNQKPLNYMTSSELGFEDYVEGNVLIPVELGGFDLYKLKEVRSFNIGSEVEVKNLQKKYMREVSKTIKEADGSLVFTDGQKTLKVYPDGSLEFADSSTVKENSDFVSAYDQAVKFMVLHGDYSENLYLMGTGISREQDDTEYIFYFGLKYNHVPVITKDGSAIIEARVLRNKVVYYKSLNKRFQPLNIFNERVLHPISAIDKALSLNNSNSKEKRRVLDIKISYYYRASDGACIPVWIVKTPGNTILIDAFKGDVVLDGLGKS